MQINMADKQITIEPATQYLVEFISRPEIAFMNTEFTGGDTTEQFDTEVSQNPEAIYTRDTKASQFAIARILAKPIARKTDDELLHSYHFGDVIIVKSGLNYDLAGTSRQMLVDPWNIVGKWIPTEVPTTINTITEEEEAKIAESSVKYTEVTEVK
jgi:hypothetical protein